MLPDEQAVEILQLVDGKTGVAAIVDSLAARYTQAPRELIAKDVTAMLQDLADKGCLAGADRIDPPLALLAELTHRCPLACPYCSNPVEPRARRGRARRAGLASRARARRPRSACCRCISPAASRWRGAILWR